LRLARIQKATEETGIPGNTLRWQIQLGRITKHKYGRSVFVDLDEIRAKIDRDTAADRDRRAARAQATEPAEAAEVRS
jgi:hypothetical protein